MNIQWILGSSKYICINHLNFTQLFMSLEVMHYIFSNSLHKTYPHVSLLSLQFVGFQGTWSSFNTDFKKGNSKTTFFSIDIFRICYEILIWECEGSQLVLNWTKGFLGILMGSNLIELVRVPKKSNSSSEWFWWCKRFVIRSEGSW